MSLAQGVSYVLTSNLAKFQRTDPANAANQFGLEDDTYWVQSEGWHFASLHIALMLLGQLRSPLSEP